MPESRLGKRTGLVFLQVNEKQTVSWDFGGEEGSDEMK